MTRKYTKHVKKGRQDKAASFVTNGPPPAIGYWTPKQLSERRQTTENQLYKERLRGDGPPFCVFGACTVRYPIDEALAWEKAQQVRSMAEAYAADKDRADAVVQLQKNMATARRSKLETAA